MRPVAIAGVGCICALGADLAACMQALFAGRRNFGLPSRFPAHCDRSMPVFEVAEDFVATPHGAGQLPLTCRMVLAATGQALEQAGIPSEALAELRVGVALGTNIGVTAGYAGNQCATDAFLLPRDRFLATNPTHLVAEHYRVSGPVQTVANACSAGGDAIGIGAQWIGADVCDLVIAGGADEVTPRVYTGFKSLFINDPNPCRPFDRERKGLNLGEGAALFVLVSEALQQRWNLNPQGYLLGYGASADAHHFTQPRADGLGLRLAIEEALASAGLPPDAIGFINAHGTGTPDNDRTESMVAAELFPETPFFSTKGYTGHTLGAAGPIEAALTLGCMQQGRLPATAGFETPDPELPAQPVNRPTKSDATVALSQTLAFGGSNSALIVGRSAGAS